MNMLFECNTIFICCTSSHNSTSICLEVSKTCIKTFEFITDCVIHQPNDKCFGNLAFIDNIILSAEFQF